MTTTSLTLESRQLAIDLHAFLNDLEPARWKDERADALRERLHELQQRLHDLQAAYTAQAGSTRTAILAHVAELRELLDEHRPSFEGHSRLEELRESWMALRERAEPAYEALAASLKANDVAVPSLRPTNYTRNLFHVGAAALSIAIVEIISALAGADLTLLMIIAGAFALAGWTMELSRRVSERANVFLMKAFRLVAHPHEAHHVNSATWYVTALFLLSLTMDPVVCVVALAILGLADPAAAIIGKRFGRIRFENGRSVEGTITFIVVGTAAALAVILGLHPAIAPFWKALVIAASAATVGGITELVSKRVDDNLGIPVAAGAAALIMQWLIL